MVGIKLMSNFNLFMVETLGYNVVHSQCSHCSHGYVSIQIEDHDIVHGCGENDCIPSILKMKLFHLGLSSKYS